MLANIQDAVLNNNNPNEWEQDSFEIFVDENNGKTSSYEGVAVWYGGTITGHGFFVSGGIVGTVEAVTSLAALMAKTVMQKIYKVQ